MHELSETIFATWQVRKRKKQKAAFRCMLGEALRAQGYAVTEEHGRFSGTNVVVGDLSRARYVFSAHYDTCAVLPVPNFLAPKNIPISLLYQVFLVFVMFLVLLVVAFVISFPLYFFLPDTPIVDTIAKSLPAIVVLALFFFGPANRHTANDNTSGVTVLTEALCSLPDEYKDKVAFVFFDNEELGLLGSAAFRQRHEKEMRGKTLVNFDCVSDGDYIMCVLGKALWPNEKDRAEMEAAFALPEGKTGECVSSRGVLYPSDQMHFPRGACVAAFKERRGVGYYINRIHTRRDTEFDRENIEALRLFVLRLVMG